MERVVLPLLLLAILGLAVWWLWTTRPQPASEQSAPTATPAVETPPAEPVVSGPPAGYRLAGLAVGEPASFAVIELPNGNSQLYRVDGKVAGLGRIVEITEAGATIDGEHGRFTLQLKPAPTPTPDRRRVNGETADEATTVPERPEDPGDKALEPVS